MRHSIATVSLSGMLRETLKLRPGAMQWFATLHNSRDIGHASFK